MVTLNPVSATSDITADSWNTKTSMSQARGGLGVVAVDDKIYAIGGKTVDGVIVGTNEQYDPKTDTWTTLKAMPTSRAYFAIVAYNGKIYCIGGTNSEGSCAITEVYDTATDSWSTKASLPVKGKNLQDTVVTGKIFVINSDSLFMYDPATEEWAKKTSVPQSLVDSNFLALAAIDDSLIVTGKLKVMIYNPNTDVWREGAKPSTELSSGVSGATTGVCAPKKIYTIGTVTTKEEWWRYGQKEQGPEGQTSPGYVTSISPVVVVYDPVKGVWSKAKTGLNRVDFGVAVLDDILYVIGGYRITYGETTLTVDITEFVNDGTYWGTYKSVPKQFVAQESVVGMACSLNEQYVPASYRASPYVEVVSPELGEIIEKTGGVPLSFVADRTIVRAWYSLDNKNRVAIEGNATLSKFAAGEHTVTVYVEDLLGNVGTSKTVTFTTTTTASNTKTILFSNTFIIITIILIISIITAGLFLYFKNKHLTQNK